MKRRRVRRTPARRAGDPTNPFAAPAGLVIHDHALRLIQEADLAVARLADPSDPEALHDTRVALRRLRSWLRVFKPALPVKRKRLRRLRDLAHGSNLARDAEVCIAWLTAAHPRLDPRMASGAQQLAASLTKLRDTSQAEVRANLPGAWQKLARKLKQALAAPPEDDRRRFLEAYVQALDVYAEEFLRAFATARTEPLAGHIHRMRIAGKRVRYLAEVIAPWHPRAEALVRELKELQDRTGELQDLQRLMELFEDHFKGKVESQYRRVLKAYADPEIREPALPPVKHAHNLWSWLWLARALGRARAEGIERFRKQCLAPGRHTCLPTLRALLADLKRELRTPGPH